MSNTESFFNQEYNPRLSVLDHLDIMQGWQQKSEYARANAHCLLDIAYGSDQDERIDLFFADKKNSPCLIFIHGGYWRGSDKSEFSFIAKEFASRGIHVFVMNYGLAPRVDLETIVEQVRRGTQWVFDHAASYGANPMELYITGHSAGGHLAAMMMTQSWNHQEKSIIKGALPISGLFDLEPLIQASFIQPILQLDQDRARRLSPIYKKPFGTIPFWTCVGGDESSAFHSQSQLLAKAWTDSFQGVIPMPNYNHFTVMDELANPRSALHQAVLKMMTLD